MFRLPHIAPRRSPRPARDGFTLVEMLVATTLVVMMLMLFAQIFGDTVRIMRNQQALAQNDQKARSFDTLLRNDLEKATFRQVRDKGVYGLTPLRANWPVDAERQRGYFYMSENDPLDPTDDVLQFTIDTRLTHRNAEVGNLRGRATNIGSYANEPDNDDGVVNNGVGESRAAEVSYFLRGGNLYRRTLLLRKPITPSGTGAPSEFPIQPGSGADGATRLNVFNQPYSEFWNDFDYSAWNLPRDINPPDGTPDTPWVMFNGIDSLQNVVGATSHPIAMPQYRFGHRPEPFSGGTRVGCPVEYLLDASNSAVGYIGRYTHEETSSGSFDWPGAFPAATVHPMLRSNFTAAELISSSSVVNSYQNGDRAGEDLLLSGVESFDLEVWDDGFREDDFNRDGTADVELDGVSGVTALAGQWVDLGHDSYHPASTLTNNLSLLGWFQQAVTGTYRNQSFANRNTAYGARIPASVTDYVNRVFDTWHPTSTIGTREPPFCPRHIALPPVGTSQLTIVGATGWGAGASATLNTVLFPRVADPTSMTNADDDSFYYRAIIAGNTGSRQPEWPREPGATVVDGGVIWQCFDNRIGLQAVRITVRFRDPGNGSPRQVSVVHSFVE